MPAGKKWRATRNRSRSNRASSGTRSSVVSSRTRTTARSRPTAALTPGTRRSSPSPCCHRSNRSTDMSFGAGLSEHPVPTQATGEVVGQVLDALGAADDPPDLALLFVTAPHLGAIEDIAAAVRSTLNARTLLGCTAESVVAGAKEIEQRPAVALWAGHTGPVDPFHARVVPTPDGNALVGWPEEETAVEVDGASAVLVLADPFTFPADEVLRHEAEDHP